MIQGTRQSVRVRPRRCRRPALCAILVTLALEGAGTRGGEAQALQRRIRDSIDAWHRRNPATGLAVGVLQRGTTIFAGGFGTRRTGFDSAVTTRTVFHMASVSKQFVATAVLQLVEQGRLDLAAPVSRYLPYFRLRDARAAGITVQQLLNHTSGLPDVTNYQWDRPEYDAGALERFVRGLADSALVSAPGERYQYSNIGYEVAADVIAKVSGQPFEDYMQQNILTPLGMHHSTFLMTDIDSTNLALPHVRNSKGVVRLLDSYTYNRAHGGSGTLHSNVEDMLRWAEANLRGGELGGRRIVSPATIQRLWASTVDLTEENNVQAYLSGTPTPFEGIGYGLGWRWYRMNGRRLVGHGGQDDGFRVHILLGPSDSAAVVVLTNDYAGDPGDLARILYRLVRDSRSR